MSTLYDFTNVCWGHNINVLGPGRIAGWSYPRPRDGDLLKWRTTHGDVVRQVFNVEHCRDPGDMWFANYRDPAETQEERAENVLGVVGCGLIVVGLFVSLWVLL